MKETGFKKAIADSWRLRREKRFPEAELVLHEALENCAEGDYARNTLRAQLADVLLQQGKAGAAKELALEVLAKEPRQVTALTVLGAAALERKEYMEAVENLTKAYEYAPNPFRAGRLARALELDEQIGRASAVLEEALGRYPADGYLLRQYGALQRKAGTGDPVGPEFGVEEHPLAPVAGEDDDPFAYAERMRLRLRETSPEEAVRQLEKIIRIGRRRDNSHLHLLLGDLRRRAGDEPGAAVAYRQALELAPENSYALSHLVFSLRRLGEKGEAWPLLKRLLTADPGSRVGKAAFLKDAVDLGKIEEAVAFLEELLRKFPQHKELYGLIKKLSKEANTGKGEEESKNED